MNKLTLASLKKNDVFKIVDFDESCKNFKNRLYSLGISKNQIGQIINKSFFGPMEIDINGKKIAICRGISRKIYVKKFECPILKKE